MVRCIPGICCRIRQCTTRMWHHPIQERNPLHNLLLHIYTLLLWRVRVAYNYMHARSPHLYHTPYNPSPSVHSILSYRGYSIFLSMTSSRLLHNPSHRHKIHCCNGHEVRTICSHMMLGQYTGCILNYIRQHKHRTIPPSSFQCTSNHYSASCMHLLCNGCSSHYRVQYTTHTLMRMNQSINHTSPLTRTQNRCKNLPKGLDYALRDQSNQYISLKAVLDRCCSQDSMSLCTMCSHARSSHYHIRTRHIHLYGNF